MNDAIELFDLLANLPSAEDCANGYCPTFVAIENLASVAPHHYRKDGLKRTRYYTRTGAYPCA